MTNAKVEFLEETKGKNVLCAKIVHQQGYFDPTTVRSCILRLGYSETELTQFLESLDFEYNSGFGGQELHGLIWYKDGTWSERGEYDGSEWWEYQSFPAVPEECQPQNDTESNVAKSCDTCGIKSTFWCPCETRHTMQDCGEGTDHPYWQPKSDNAEEDECDG